MSRYPRVSDGHRRRLEVQRARWCNQAKAHIGRHLGRARKDVGGFPSHDARDFGQGDEPRRVMDNAVFFEGHLAIVGGAATTVFSENRLEERKGRRVRVWAGGWGWERGGGEEAMGDDDKSDDNEGKHEKNFIEK